MGRVLRFHTRMDRLDALRGLSARCSCGLNPSISDLGLGAAGPPCARSGRLRYLVRVSGGRTRRVRGRPQGAGSGPSADRPECLSGVHVVREALRAGRRSFGRLWVDPSARRGEVAALVGRAERLGVPVSEAATSEWVGRLDAASRRANPQGIMLEAGPLPAVGLEELIASLPEGDGCLVMLDEVEDPQNVGALIRAAETAGAQGLILPARRSPPLGGAVSRASSGALEWLPVARVGNLARALDRLKEANAWVVGAEHTASVSLYELSDRQLAGRLVVVLGSEGRGLREGVRKRVDFPVSIPMHGQVGSLNVSTAGAVILYELVRRRSLLSQMG